MSSPNKTPLQFGDVKGSIYDFALAGDEIGKHYHTPENVHFTVVARGSVKAYSHDWEVTALPGQIINFRVNQPHGIIALENNTRIINILKSYKGSEGQIEGEP